MAQRLKHLPAVRETWVWSLGLEDPLEKEMATHSSILDWRIPWTEEPGGYSPRGCKELYTTEQLSTLGSTSVEERGEKQDSVATAIVDPSGKEIWCSKRPPKLYWVQGRRLALWTVIFTIHWMWVMWYSADRIPEGLTVEGCLLTLTAGKTSLSLLC